MTDDELIASIQRLAGAERRGLVFILRHLQEMDERRLAPRRAYPSLFEYCVRELRWAEGEAAKRIQVARTSVRFPPLLGALRRGLLSLSTAALIAPRLNRQNYSTIVRKAYGRRTREVEALVAALSPKAEPKERARFLGIVTSTGTAAEHAKEPGTPAVEPHAPSAAGGAPLELPAVAGPQRVLFSFTSDERLLADVERAKELLRNKYGDPGFESVFIEAMRALLEKIDPDRRSTKARAPVASEPGDPRSRTPPSWVKRAVWRRDSGHCSFRGEGGRLCRSRSGLQFDHVVPWALGGRSDDPANLRLLCRTHNRLEARRCLGDGVVDAALDAARARRGSVGS